jgi:quercetin dioxygenase-like cupin family protein
MAPEEGGAVIPPGGGEALTYPRGGRMTIKARSADTRGAYTLLEFAIPPGGTGSPPHYHVAMEEAFYIVAGELTFTLEERTARVTAGSFIFVPRGVVHAFKNEGGEPTRCLILASPGDFEGYFRELSELTTTAPGHQPDSETLARIAEKYGQQFAE